MVDTLRPYSSFHHGLSPECEYPQKTTTEPDNGHNTETLKLDYKQESVRLESFIGFKSDAVKPEDLAKAGFYFLNSPSHLDLVKCAYCNAEICRWEIGDNPWEEHMKWAPDCPFVKQHQSSNRRSLSFLSTQESGQDVCGNAEIFYNSLPENETFRLLNGVVRANYEEEKVRLESFATWPKSSKQKPIDLAAAGFYYRGVDDHTICFKCNGALKEWMDEDDPWEQHALWYPHCKHIVSKKGAEYIADVKRKFRSSVPSNSETKEKECKESASEEQDPPLGDEVVRCRICNDNERNIVFMPCRHIVACDKCSRQFETCPVCRERIDNKVKVFIS